MKWYRITLSYACYGIAVEDGVIKKAAPVARWSIGKRLEYFERWIRRKGGTIEELKSEVV